MCQWEERNRRRSGCLSLHRWLSHRYKEAQAKYEPQFWSGTPKFGCLLKVTGRSCIWLWSWPSFLSCRLWNQAFKSLLETLYLHHQLWTYQSFYLIPVYVKPSCSPSRCWPKVLRIQVILTHEPAFHNQERFNLWFIIQVPGGSSCWHLAVEIQLVWHSINQVTFGEGRMLLCWYLLIPRGIPNHHADSDPQELWTPSRR